MKKVKFFNKGVIILLLTITLILTSFNVIANTRTTQSLSKTLILEDQDNVCDSNINNYEFPQKQSDLGFPKGLFTEVLIGRAEGEAISGKLIGFRGKIVKINFEYLRIEVRRLFPFRWEMSDFRYTTAFMFNVNQTIPQGPFHFESEWIVAIVFK